jgi:hypothetical protein
MSVSQSKDVRKLCTRCKQRKFISEFPGKLYQVCTACWPREGDDLAAYADELRTNQQNSTTVVKHGVAYGTTREGIRKYARDYQRQIAEAKREAERKARQLAGLPEPLPSMYDLLNRPRFCRRCRQWLSRDKFENKHVRICLACDKE